MLTGLAELKITDTNLDTVILYLINNFYFIFVNGFNRIFFYEAYSNSFFSFANVALFTSTLCFARNEAIQRSSNSFW